MFLRDSGKDTDFHAFLDQFKTCTRMNGWNDKEKGESTDFEHEGKSVCGYVPTRTTRVLTTTWSRLYAKKSECARSPKPQSTTDEERWEKLCKS